MSAPQSHFTLADTFEQAARSYGERTAIVDPVRSLSFEALNRESDTVARFLARLGAGSGDRVAFLGPNSACYLSALGASAKIGAIFVPLHSRLQADEVGFMLRDSDASVLFVDEAAASDVRRAIARVPAVQHVVELPPGGGAPFAPTGSADREPPPEPPRAVVGPQDIAAIMYTAATDGRPRGAMIPHRAMIAQNVSLALVLGIHANDRYGAFTPLSHTAALSCVLACLHAGAEVVLAERFDPVAAAQTIQRHEVTITLGFPPMATALLDAAERDGIQLSSLRIRLGFDAIDVIERYLERLPGLRWMVGNFGQTETNGMAVLGTLIGFSELVACDREVPGGREMPLTRVRIVDGDSREVAAGEVGQIVVRGPTTAAGYWNDSEATRKALRDGWWHTGDLGRVDATGGIRFVGPAPRKELIKTGGENVYSREVERVLLEHPVVQGCCVVGVPDATWGQSVKAVVVLVEPNGAEVTADELIDFCGERLTRYKKPRFVEFVRALPRTASGEVDRDALRQIGV